MDEALKQENRQEKIDRLVDAALPEFARRGLHGARVDAIARAAAMNKRLLYHYVGNKEALFRAARDRAVRRLCDDDPASATASGLADPATVDAWRLLCHAELEGLGLDAAARSALVGHWHEAGLAGLAETLLRVLLPALAEDLAATTQTAEPATTNRTDSGAKAQGAQAVKPRLKLRPRLRRQPRGGE